MSFLLFLLVTALGVLLMSFFEPKTEASGLRLKRLVQRRAAEQAGAAQSESVPADARTNRNGRRHLPHAARQAVVGVVERATTGATFTGRLAVELQRADWKWKPAEFITAQLIAAGIGLLIALFISRLLLLVLPLLGWFMPRFLLNRAIQQRVKTLTQQLPDALAMVANALRSGFSFLQALDVVSRDMPAPISQEFGQVLRENRVNIPMEEAMANMVNRVQSSDLDLVVTAVLIQRQVGGNLSEVLDKIGGTVQERIRLHGEVRALTAQGRASGWVVSLLPIGLGIVINLMSPGFMAPLFSSLLGWALLVGGAVMQLTGILVIRKMVNVEV